MNNHSDHINSIDCCKSRKHDLSDFTFLFPLRNDSVQRKENADTTINLIHKYFETSFIVVEGDSDRKYFPSLKGENLLYEFSEDKNELFHKIGYINNIIRMAETKYLAVWDTDVIAASKQILESAAVIRRDSAKMSIPYDGRVFVCDSSLSSFFRNNPRIDLLERLSPSLPFMYGYHSTGGAFLINKEEYLKAGGENENFYGWGPEDVERVKRMEVMGFSVHFSSGPLFHFWHPRGATSRYLDKGIEKRNIKEFVKTCASNKRSV